MFEAKRFAACLPSGVVRVPEFQFGPKILIEANGKNDCTPPFGITNIASLLPAITLFSGLCKSQITFLFIAHVVGFPPGSKVPKEPCIKE
ncbi:hypothetical protein D3C84_760110 [compost metagenome]